MLSLKWNLSFPRKTGDDSYFNRKQEQKYKLISLHLFKDMKTE